MWPKLIARDLDGPCPVLKFRHSIVGTVLFSLVPCTSILRAQDGLPGALSRVERTSYAVSQLSSPIAAADIDNDQKPDGAILLETGFLNGTPAFRIDLHLTNNNNTISFSSAESALAISALDVNRDGAPDIVIERAFTGQRQAVYLNDGHGAFHRARTEDYPSPSPAAPDWRAQQIQDPTAFCLPVSRGLELERLQRIATVRQDSSGRLRSWLEVLLARSKPRAPTSSRAPPSHFSL